MTKNTSSSIWRRCPHRAAGSGAMVCDAAPAPVAAPLLLPMLLLLFAAWHRISVRALKADTRGSGAPCEDRLWPVGAGRCWPWPWPGGGGRMGGGRAGGPIDMDRHGMLFSSWQMGGGGPCLVRTGTGGGGPAGVPGLSLGPWLPCAVCAACPWPCPGAEPETGVQQRVVKHRWREGNPSGKPKSCYRRWWTSSTRSGAAAEVWRRRAEPGRWFGRAVP